MKSNPPDTLSSTPYPTIRFPQTVINNLHSEEEHGERKYICDGFIADLTVPLHRAINNAKLFWCWMSACGVYSIDQLNNWTEEIYKYSDTEVEQKLQTLLDTKLYTIPKDYETYVSIDKLENTMQEKFDKQWKDMVKEQKTLFSFSKEDLEKIKQDLSGLNKSLQDAGFTVYTIDNKGELQELNPPSQKKQSSQFKQELISAGYRVVSSQVSEAIKATILTQLPPDKVPALTSLLNSEAGTALVSMLAGLALTYSFKDNERAQKLAQEFRINSLTTFGNAALEGLAETIINSLQHSVEAIPAIEETKVLEASFEEILPVEEANELKTLN